MSQHDATRLPLEDDLKMMNEQMKDREPSEIEQEYNSTYFTARPPTLKQWLIERIRALTQEVATLKAELDEEQRAKYGTPCRCESWIETCRLAEERAEALDAALATLRSELQKANEPKACPDCGRYPGERAIQIGDTSDDKSEGE